MGRMLCRTSSTGQPANGKGERGDGVDERSSCCAPTRLSPVAVEPVGRLLGSPNISFVRGPWHRIGEVILVRSADLTEGFPRVQESESHLLEGRLVTLGPADLALGDRAKGFDPVDPDAGSAIKPTD